MSVNGFDDSKNKKEVYTKEELNALLNEVKTKVFTSSCPSDTGDNKLEVTIRRSGNVVTVRVEVNLQPTELINYSNFESIVMPEWATPKRTYNHDSVQNKVIARSVTTPTINSSDNAVGGAKQDAQIWFNTSKGICQLMGTCINYSQSESKIDVVTLTYIVDDELPDGDYQLGDVNGDGVINEEDYNLVQNYIMGYEGLSEKQKILADVNKDGEVTSVDYMRIKNYVEGTIDSLE